MWVHLRAAKVYDEPMIDYKPIAAAALLLLAGCAPSRHSEWDDIDYSRVYQRARENDPSYTAPTVVGCVDDDLYNCNQKRK